MPVHGAKDQLHARYASRTVSGTSPASRLGLLGRLLLHYPHGGLPSVSAVLARFSARCSPPGHTHPLLPPGAPAWYGRPRRLISLGAEPAPSLRWSSFRSRRSSLRSSLTQRRRRQSVLPCDSVRLEWGMGFFFWGLLAGVVLWLMDCFPKNLYLSIYLSET